MTESRKKLDAIDANKSRLLRKTTLSVMVALCLAMPNIGLAKKSSSSDQPKAESSEAAAPVPSSDSSIYTLTLEDIGATRPVDLLYANGQRGFDFSMRNDLLVTSAKLKLNYRWSPALIPELSHLKVMLNGEVMTSLPLNHENANGHTSEVKLDESMFIDFNQLNFGLIAHYTRDCEDPTHSSLWANISNKSRLELTVKHLNLGNDLNQLPGPFFDRLDHRKLELPIVFLSQPNNDVLHAAGVVTSWFGGFASYRGAKFSTVINVFPKSNAVVMIVGSSAPAELNLPMINGPSLAVVNNPNKTNSKLLVVMGRDAKELDVAAQALTLASPTLTGNFVSVKELTNIPLRKPYDAPNWIPTDRPVHFGELAKLDALQVAQLDPELIRVKFSIPPDIFSWESQGVPVDLLYRYNQHPTQDRSSLVVSLNDKFIKSLTLTPKPSVLENAQKMLTPSVQDISEQDHFHVPHNNFYASNQLQFKYYFDYVKEGLCKDVFINNDRGAIAPESTIDFSSFSHYTALPNLGYFAQSGFPYTRMADLSETAVVMPDNASIAEIDAYLAVMARMGQVTGYPAIRHAITSASNIESHSSKDLIVIGTAGNQALLTRWANKVNPLLENGSHTLRVPSFFERLLARWENRDLDDAFLRAGDLISNGSAGLGALVAFESPLKSGRSVVVLTGDTPEEISSLATSMTEAKLAEKFQGDLVLQSGKRVESFNTGPTYYVGSLKWWTAFKWYFSRNPFVMYILLGISAVLAGVIGFRFLRKLADKRLEK